MRAATAHQSASTNYHRSFLIHINKVSAKRHRIKISRDYIADQITKLCYETVKNAERTFNEEYFVSLIQRKKSTCSVRKAVTRRLRMSHHNNQKLTVSETAFSLTT